jgi:hypothetical protein
LKVDEFLSSKARTNKTPVSLTLDGRMAFGTTGGCVDEDVVFVTTVRAVDTFVPNELV